MSRVPSHFQYNQKETECLFHLPKLKSSLKCNSSFSSSAEYNCIQVYFCKDISYSRHCNGYQFCTVSGQLVKRNLEESHLSPVSYTPSPTPEIPFWCYGVKAYWYSVNIEALATYQYWELMLRWAVGRRVEIVTSNPVLQDPATIAWTDSSVMELSFAPAFSCFSPAVPHPDLIPKRVATFRLFSLGYSGQKQHIIWQ